MATSTPQQGNRKKYQLSVNTYDRTTTMIIALLVIVGMFVSGLLVIFFANKSFPTIEPIPVVPVEATSPNANQGLAEEPDPPGIEDAPDLSEPQLQDTLDVLSNSMQDIVLSDEILDAQSEMGKGKGLGDARMAGDGSGGVVERVPRWERWKIRFEPDSADDFASWLDFYKIELGVLGRDNLVHYAGSLSSSSPKIRAAPPKQENRGYTSAADGPMPRLTNELARKADIARLGNVVLLFYPFKEVESRLYILEQQWLKEKGGGERDVNSIRQTTFTVIRDGSSYKFEVIEQKYF